MLHMLHVAHVAMLHVELHNRKVPTKGIQHSNQNRSTLLISCLEFIKFNQRNQGLIAFYKCAFPFSRSICSDLFEIYQALAVFHQVFLQFLSNNFAKRHFVDSLLGVQNLDGTISCI